VAGYVLCNPQGHEKLVLGTYVPGRKEGEILTGEDVNPAITLFSTNIAPQLEGDLTAVKENFLEDLDGLKTLLSGPNLPEGPLTDISLGTDTRPTNSEVGLVAFSVTALFNALHKNDHDVDFPGAIADLTDNAAVDPENPVDPAFLEAQGVPTDQAQAYADLVNGSIDTAAQELGTDLATALSTARVNVTVMGAANGGDPISGAIVDIENGLDCNGCGDATDANGRVTLTLKGISKEATTIEVTVSSIPGFDTITAFTEVVAFATVDLDLFPGNIEICDDLIDNDRDGDIDCYDSDCETNSACACTDNDGDGYYDKDYCPGERDCDDTDVTIHPTAIEDCSDSMDNDCDGFIDCNDTDCSNDSHCVVNPFSGSFSGTWSGDCYGNISGSFSITISISGEVTGSYTGDESGSINGTVGNDGTFQATGSGSAGTCSWIGSMRTTTQGFSGSGSWSCFDECDGSWSGSGR
jgi:hypothetical protein